MLGFIDWIMGAMTNDPFTLARYAGFYKGLQSAGSAVSFGVDAVATPVRPISPLLSSHPLSLLTVTDQHFLALKQKQYLSEHLSSWIMLLVSLPLVGIVISTVIDTNYDKEGVVYENEVIETDHGLEKISDLPQEQKEATVSVDTKSVA